MSSTVVVILGVLGFFVASATWTIARNQASRRPLFGLPLCDAGDGETRAMTWFPLMGFGMARTCPSNAGRQSAKRLLYEFAVAGYFALAALRIDDGMELVSVVVFSIPLLIIFLVDSWTRLIHTNIIGLGVMLGLLFAALDGVRQLGSSVIAMAAAAAVFAGIFFLAIVIYRNPKVVPFGLGDVYLAAMIGAMVRLDDVVRALFTGILLAGISLALLLVLKRVSRKQAVPYGPYLALGAMIALVF
jgi:prepilin signal peptidase PulO-like enzyme (type II secretory pathway)